MAIPKPIHELRAQRLAAIARMGTLNEKVMKRLGGVRPDGDAILRDIAEGRDDGDDALEPPTPVRNDEIAPAMVLASEGDRTAGEQTSGNS
jgi:hypothetical protein